MHINNVTEQCGAESRWGGLLLLYSPTMLTFFFFFFVALLHVTRLTNPSDSEYIKLDLIYYVFLLFILIRPSFKSFFFLCAQLTEIADFTSGMLKVMFCVFMQSTPPHNYTPTKMSILLGFDLDMTRERESERKRWFHFSFFSAWINLEIIIWHATVWAMPCNLLRIWWNVENVVFSPILVKHYNVNFTITHISRKVELFAIRSKK